MKKNKLNLLAVLLTMAALIAGQTAQATVTQSMAFEGFFNSNTSMHYWRIHGFWGTVAGPTMGSSGTSQTFNNNTFTFNGGHRITINGTLNFAVANNFTDVTTGSQVTLVFESSNYWFYGATVKTLSDANVSGCSYTISDNNHSITVTIPSGKTFGNVYLECVNHAPMTNDNTTVTVPAGDYWVSDNNHKPKPEPTVVYGQTTLVKDTDYTLSWSNNSSAGTGTVTVTGMGNYYGTVSATFPIRWATYTVRFDKNHNDATGTMSDQQFTYNTAQNLTANAFSLGSYPFAGWSTTPNGEVAYTDGQSVSNLTAVDGETVTLYAQWTQQYTFNSTTGALTLNWGEFNKDNKWGSDVDPSKVTSVTATNEVSFTGDCYNLFYYFTNCTSMDLSNVNTDGLTNIRRMFWACSSLTTLDLSSWNTAAVTQMISTFRGCTGLTSLNLTGWNTANVTTMKNLFYECHNLTTIEGISEWVTESVTDMTEMFYQCFRLTSLDLSGWNTAKVNDMGGMFCGCSNLATIYVGEGWSTQSCSLYLSDRMFSGCTSLVGGMGTTYDASHIDKEYARIDKGPNSDQPGYFTGSGLVESITVDPDENEMNVGATYTIIFTVLPTYATNKDVTFTSSDETVATVDADGNVTGVAAGTTTITIAATDGSGVTGTLTVTVTNIAVEEIYVDNEYITISSGETATIIYTVAPNNATIHDVTFTSANTAIATVNENGVVTGVGGGTTTITIASVSNPEVTADVSVTVPGDRYQLFTGDLVEGDYLIVCNGKAMEHKHISAKFYYKEVTAIDNVITTDDADIVWHIAPNNGYWTIYNDVVKKYVAESTKNGEVTLYDDISYEQTHWSFSQYGTSYDIVNRRFYGSVNCVYLSYRYGSINGFGCSDLSHGDDRPSLYKKVGDPVTETYTLEIDGYTSQTTGWHLIASPVSTPITPTEENGFLANTFDLYRFNQAANAEWENWKADGTDHYHFNLESGRGYLYANSGNVTLTFTGTPYVGNGEVWITNTHYVEFEGWNLVGNPFSVEATINQDFYRMNDVGSEIVPATGNTVNPMEGIFVYTTFSGGYVTFDRCSNKAKGGNGNNASLVINLSKGNRGSVIDRAIVRFDSERTLPKLQLFEGNTKLYIPQDGKEYAIAHSNGQGEMPLNFKAKKNGEYTLSFTIDNNVIASEAKQSSYFHLIDNLTGVDVDLLTTPSYTFTAKTTDYASRFKLVFSNENDNQNDDFAFISNGEIIINGEGTLQVIDALGRILFTKGITTANYQLSTANFKSGVYVLQLINGEDVKTQKIVIK